MRNQEIADLLHRMGILLEIKGELVFKIRAYFKAADVITSLPEDIEVVAAEKRLTDIPGIGKTLAEKIVEYFDTGRLQAYEKLIKDVPETLLDIVHIPSVGPKKAKLFFDELNIKNIIDLRKAAENGKLLELPKIQQKTVDNILKGLKVFEHGMERMNLGRALRTAEEVMVFLQESKEVKGVQAAGSLRRGKETVRDIDLLVQSSNPKKTMDYFVHLPLVQSVNAHGETKSSILTKDQVQVDLRIVEPESYGAALMYFTGSKNFNILLRQIAQRKKMKVNEYGVFSVKASQEKYLAGKTEKDCFKALGLQWIPPELREEGVEQDFVLEAKLPRLIEEKDIKGELHVHSTYSDGRHSIEEMAAAAKSRGYSYLAISDHSEKLRVARGVSPADLKKKKKEIDRLNQKDKDFRILFGSEVEIDTEGNLDYNRSILDSFDVVVGAVHSHFDLSPKAQTERLIKAISHPALNIMAHPTGVHLGKREAFEFDFKAVCEAAVAHNVFLEINAFPIRLDLNSSNVKFARKIGVKFVINTDAHHINHFNHMRLGVTVARRGWLEKKDVLNTCTLEQLKKKILKK